MRRDSQLISSYINSEIIEYKGLLSNIHNYERSFPIKVEYEKPYYGFGCLESWRELQ